MSYPQKLQKETKDKQFSQFLEVFGNLQINIPFVEVLEQMPLYFKFVKGVLSKKKTLKGDETVVLNKEHSAIIQSKLPRKMPDSGSFQILCTIGSTTFDKALCNLGASINLMPPVCDEKAVNPRGTTNKDSITNGRQVSETYTWNSGEFLGQGWRIFSPCRFCNP
ncbi:hypothetical protein AHAS_Ahas18G0200900 [Arachis hypogaea]